MSPGSPWSRVLRRMWITSITTDSSSIADSNDGVPITAFSLPTNPPLRSVSIHLPSVFQRGYVCLQRFETIAANPRRQLSLGAGHRFTRLKRPFQKGGKQQKRQIRSGQACLPNLISGLHCRLSVMLMQSRSTASPRSSGGAGRATRIGAKLVSLIGPSGIGRCFDTSCGCGKNNRTACRRKEGWVVWRGGAKSDSG